MLITKEEQKAIARVERAFKNWPETLAVYSASGALCITRLTPGERPLHHHISQILNVANDGGDPDFDEMDQVPELEYE